MRSTTLVRVSFVAFLVSVFALFGAPLGHTANQESSASRVDTIRGVVRDEEGAPLAGVAVGVRRSRVTAAVRAARSNRGVFDGSSMYGDDGRLATRLDAVRATWRPTLDEALAAAEEEWRTERGEVFEAVTGADGAFVFEGLEGTGAYEIDVALDGYSFDRSRGAHVSLGEELAILGRPIHRIAFEVVGEDGEVFDDVLVRLRYGPSTSGVRWERAEPWLEFTSEPVTLQFSAGGRFMEGFEPLGEYTSEAIAIDPGDPALANGPVRVVLRRHVWLTVQLEDPWSTGGGSGGRWLVAKKLADDEVFDVEAFGALLAEARPLDQLEYSRTSDSPAPIRTAIQFARRLTSTPRVHFDDLARGRYVVGVCDEAARLLTWSEVALNEPATVVTLRPPQPAANGRLVVKLVNAHDDRLRTRPRFVADARVDGRWEPVGVDVQSPPSGEHWLALGVVPERTSELRIGAIHETLGLAYAVVTPDVRELELVFPRSGTLELEVIGLDPSALSTHVQATLVFVGPHLDGEGRRERHHGYLVLDGNVRPSFGPDMKATVGGLAPGVWRVNVDCVVGGARRFLLDGGEVTIAPGATVAHVVLASKIVDLVVETDVGYAGQPLALLSVDGNVEIARAVIDAQGIARFSFVPVGPARLGFIEGQRVDMDTVTDVVVDGTRIQWRKP